jgi:hypothetical protein
MQPTPAGQAVDVFEPLNPEELGGDALHPTDPAHKLDIVGDNVSERHPRAIPAKVTVLMPMPQPMSSRPPRQERTV